MPIVTAGLIAVIVVAAAVAAWHLAIFLATLAAAAWQRRRDGRRVDAPPPDSTQLPAIRNFRVVDTHLWRGGRPDAAGYRALAENGVTMIVDLREGLSAAPSDLRRLGVDVAHVPIVDGTLPTADQVKQALAAIGDSAGRAYVHCAAGVGRTGTIVASYLRESRHTTRWQSLLHNLSVGPPSLEQIVYVFTSPSWPPAIVVAVSRFLDAPRVYFGKLRYWLKGPFNP